MANEFKHGSVGTELSQAEWEAIGAHIFDSQAIGDLLYASSPTQLSRLAIGAANTILTVDSGSPAWKTAAQLLVILSGQAGAAFAWNAQRLTGVADPTAAQDAATKNYVDTIMPYLLKTDNMYLQMPFAGSWVSVSSGSGTAEDQARPHYGDVGVTLGTSSRLIYAPSLNGLNRGGNNLDYINWDKELLIIFDLTMAGTIAGTDLTRYVQIKQAATHGDLAANGIGIKVTALAAVGESYGASGQATVDLATSFVASRPKQVIIHHRPGTDIRWYLDGVLKGTQSTAGYIPSGVSAAGINLVISIGNAGATTQTCWSHVGMIRIWQAA